MIKVKNLHKTFNGIEVLKGIDFEINKGDVVAVLGPSGSGKTTILRCINFLNTTDAGELTFDDQTYDLATISKAEIAKIRKKTGFVFQNYNLFLNKTVLDNVTEGLVIARKVNREEARIKAIEALKKVGMDHKIDAYPSELSGGQQQRVAIARSLVYEPEVIYFDEPTSALDPELIGEVLNVMRDLAKTGITMIVVTHEMTFAKNVSNRVIFLENGNIVEDTDSKTFFENSKNERIKKFIENIERKGE